MKFLKRRIQCYRQRDEWYSMTKDANIENWYVYIVECNDQTLYTGITKNLERRVKEHNSSNRGAKYTRCRRPVKLLASKHILSRSDALKLEAKVKKQKKQNKVKFLLGVKKY
jgi:putative endonuclease